MMQVIRFATPMTHNMRSHVQHESNAGAYGTNDLQHSLEARGLHGAA